MPERIQRQRTKGWRMPAGAVYVGRPSFWGNPFSIANAIETGFAKDDTSARVLCVEAHAHWLRGGNDWNWAGSDAARDARLANLSELRGKDLACWCPLDQPCHADVLLELANAKEHP